MTANVVKEALDQRGYEMNKQTMKTMMSSAKMDWQTPQAFFDKLNQEFGFTLDPATNGTNALCPFCFQLTAGPSALVPFPIQASTNWTGIPGLAECGKYDLLCLCNYLGLYAQG